MEKVTDFAHMGKNRPEVLLLGKISLEGEAIIFLLSTIYSTLKYRITERPALQIHLEFLTATEVHSSYLQVHEE